MQKKIGCVRREGAERERFIQPVKERNEEEGTHTYRP
jgi:hypothetical protein